MAPIIADFLAISGLAAIPPDNLAELIPYVVTLVIAVALVSGVFRAIGTMADVLLSAWRWR